MATIRDITRAGNTVQIAAHAKVLIGKGLKALGEASRSPGLTLYNRRALERRRVPLQKWWDEIKLVPDSRPYQTQYRARRSLVEGAFIEIAGVAGEVLARQQVSLFAEIKKRIPEVGQEIGSLARSVAQETGDVAGGLFGGIFKGLGPVALGIIIVLVFFRDDIRRVFS